MDTITHNHTFPKSSKRKCSLPRRYVLAIALEMLQSLVSLLSYISCSPSSSITLARLHYLYSPTDSLQAVKQVYHMSLTPVPSVNPCAGDAFGVMAPNHMEDVLELEQRIGCNGSDYIELETTEEGLPLPTHLKDVWQLTQTSRIPTNPRTNT